MGWKSQQFFLKNSKKKTQKENVDEETEPQKNRDDVARVMSKTIKVDTIDEISVKWVLSILWFFLMKLLETKCLLKSRIQTLKELESFQQIIKWCLKNDFRFLNPLLPLQQLPLWHFKATCTLLEAPHSLENSRIHASFFWKFTQPDRVENRGNFHANREK